MEIKLFTLLTLCANVLAYDYSCNEKSVLLLAKKPSYEFSVKMLQKINEDTHSHFVYSPISTWLQLSALAEGAAGTTWREIWRVTKQHRNKCFRDKLGIVLNKLRRQLRNDFKRQPVITMDRMMKVKKSYILKIQRLYGINVMLLNFNYYIKSANAVNSVIKRGTGGVIDSVVYYDDFNSSVLLISDANYFKSQWKTPFNIESTTLQPFYSSYGIEKYVSMMNQVGYFHLADFPFLGASVLEIPFATRRIIMLVFLPTNKPRIDELFYRLSRTSLSSIFNMYKRVGTVLVNVTMPRFKQSTDVGNLAELLYDMGIKTIFDPREANFTGISNNPMYMSLMTQMTNIEINEKGVKAAANFLVNNNTAVEFLVNKPFAYMIVDRKTDFILFAGVYSRPGEY